LIAYPYRCFSVITIYAKYIAERNELGFVKLEIEIGIEIGGKKPTYHYRSGAGAVCLE
jgi:hypothetical protein